MAQRSSRRAGAPRTTPRDRHRSRADGDEGIIPVLAKTVRQVEAAAQRGKVAAEQPHGLPGRRPAGARGTRPGQGGHDDARGRADRDADPARRHRHDPRQDGGPRHLAARAAGRGRRRCPRRRSTSGTTCSAAAGREPDPEPEPEPEAAADPAAVDAPRRPADGHRAASSPTPSSPRTSRRWRASAAPDDQPARQLGAAHPPLPRLRVRRRRHVHAAARARPTSSTASGTWSSCTTRPRSSRPPRPATARSCSPTSRAWARPRRRCSPPMPRTPSRSLVVVPNVVKANWAHEAELWTPRRTATVIHGDGETIDGFADIVIVNYDILDRHVGWLGNHGFRGMVVDEAHFIKNKSSQRSQHVLELSERIRARNGNALLMALTGTPLINDIEDFRAIWQFLGWIDDTKPRPRPHGGPRGDRPDPRRPRVLHGRAHQRHRPRHRATAQGRRRRRHPGPPRRRPAGRARRRGRPLDPRRGAGARPPPASRATRRRWPPAPVGAAVEGIDHDLVRRVAAAERKNAGSDKTGDNVFTRHAPDRAGQGRPRRRLRRPAGPQRRQGRVLRQAHRRHGRRGADLRQAGHRLRLDPR